MIEMKQDLHKQKENQIRIRGKTQEIALEMLSALGAIYQTLKHDEEESAVLFKTIIMKGLSEDWNLWDTEQGLIVNGTPLKKEEATQ